ncbi:MAG TPA: hypothetical protein VK759_06725 [Rhizomicrobium sp.]|jgi:hypothetical protein|nr:hypothetical protein [Rhizomicrobium sp.]
MAGANKSGGKVQGEGDYEGARDYDARAEGFVKKNKSKIPTYAKNAEKALEGPEGAELRKAEEKGKSKARR